MADRKNGRMLLLMLVAPVPAVCRLGGRPSRIPRGARTGTMHLYLSLYIDPALVAAVAQLAAQCLLLRRR